MLYRNVTHAMNKEGFGQSLCRHFPAERRISVELVPETRREAEISGYVNQASSSLRYLSFLSSSLVDKED